jgi:membrane fusion protein, multidrug efflux system
MNRAPHNPAGGVIARQAWVFASIVTLAVPLVLLGCKREDQADAPVPRPVRTVTVEPSDAGDAVVLIGHIDAQDSSAMAFRIGGRMVQRFVNVGDTVKPGQELGRLDAQNEVNALRAAQAQQNAAQAQLTQSRSAFERQRTLLTQGHTPRAQFELAEKALSTAQANADAAEVQVRIAADNVSYTVLQADAAGTVTSRGAEPGEVVRAGQMIVTIARKDGRDAVFDVPAQVLRSAPSDPRVMVRLTDDPNVVAEGRVREVAPQADPVTRTFAVRVGLTDAPPAMRLGATVNGTMRLEADQVIAIPASALTEVNRQPAVWVVDPQKLTVSLRNIETLSFDQASVTVAHGLTAGDVVVTAGIQALHPGQTVRLLGPASPGSASPGSASQ